MSPKVSTADLLVSIARSGCMLFHTPDGDLYATLTIEDRRQRWPSRARGCRRWLQREYHEHMGTSPNAEAVTTALGTLEGLAQFEGHEEPVFVRTAGIEGETYIDLGNDRWE